MLGTITNEAALADRQVLTIEVSEETMEAVPWSRGTWTHEPAVVTERDGDLLVTPAAGSDAWRLTSYGFVHDNAPALVTTFAVGAAMEVEFTATFAQQFDQAGLFIAVTSERWVKTGVEFADGYPQLGAVVTDGYSDWSLARTPDWLNQRICIRASRDTDSISLRAGLVGQELNLIRLIPFSADLKAKAGPYACSPTGANLTVPFHSWREGPADEALH